MTCRSSLCVSLAVTFAFAFAEPGTRYRAAVVQIGPAVRTVNNRWVAWMQQMQNVKAIDRWAGKAVEQGADIIVFPEDFLSGISFGSTPDYDTEPLPEASSDPICINEQHPKTIAEAIACVAKKHRILIVTGIGDAGTCVLRKNPFNKQSFPCEKGVAPFNAIAAFGIDGNMLAKYRKSHLANSRITPSLEPWAQADTPEAVTFQSHFGVRFGMFICNDSNFGGPIRGILKQGVRDILFPTYWINIGYEGNLQLALPWQDAFSRAHGVNFIAANSEGAGLLSSGSGIWPANVSKPFVQYLDRTVAMSLRTTEGWMGVLDLESPTLQKPISAEVAYPKDAPRIVDDGSAKVVIASLAAGSPSHLTASVPGAECQLDAEVIEGQGLFGLIASAGILDFGWYAGRCALLACPDGMGKDECATTLMSCAKNKMALAPPLDQCSMQVVTHPQGWVSTGPRLGNVQLRIKAPGTNTFFPSAMCGNYLVPETRSKVSVDDIDETEHVLNVAAGACDVTAALNIEGRAQSEQEEAECHGCNGQSQVSGLSRSELYQSFSAAEQTFIL